MRTRVKICGVTRQQDAEFAAKIGVDAIGLVFYAASPRAVDVAQAQQVLTALPPFVTRVGLFVDAAVDDVHSVLTNVSLDVLQFHGDETPSYCRQFNKPYMKAVRMTDETNLATVAADYHDANALLLDAFEPGIAGGTGKTFDWSLINEISTPIVLAGGLTASNIAEAIRRVKPYAVDVSSGVELSKGIKSNEKMREFMQEVMHV